MLIVNKVPTLNSLERKRKKGKTCRDRKDMLDETYKEVSQALGISFKYEFFLEDESLEGAEEFNTSVYNSLRGLIYSRSFHLDASKVRTWNDICDFYRKYDGQMTDQIMTELKSDLENKLDKVEWDIADIKYFTFSSLKMFMEKQFT